MPMFKVRSDERYPTLYLEAPFQDELEMYPEDFKEIPQGMVDQLDAAHTILRNTEALIRRHLNGRVF